MSVKDATGGTLAPHEERLVSTEPSWERFVGLLAPIHDRAAATARRLCGSAFDGDDLLQDAVLRAWRKLPLLRDPSCFRSWFYTILLSVHRNRTRRAFWRRFLSLEQALEHGPEPAGEDGVARHEERRRCERAVRALATLPAVQREAVVLFDVEGYSIREIGALQRVSESAVKSRLVRGRERLRRHYERVHGLAWPAAARPAPAPEPDGATSEVGSA